MTPDDMKNADFLALSLVDRWCTAARDRGFVRTKRPESSRLAQMRRQRENDRAERIGDPVVAPAGTGDVGSGARPSYRDPHPVGMLMERLVRDRGWGQRLDIAKVIARWPQIVGDAVAANCPVESFEDGVLTLRARSTSWQTQVTTLLARLDQRLTEELGPDVVKDIVVKGPERPTWPGGRYAVKGRGYRDTFG